MESLFLGTAQVEARKRQRVANFDNDSFTFSLRCICSYETPRILSTLTIEYLQLLHGTYIGEMETCCKEYLQMLNTKDR